MPSITPPAYWPNTASDGLTLYFSRGEIFVAEAEDMIAKNEMYGAEGKKEFYLAPVYDRLIKKGHRVEVAKIPQVWGLGTPKDVEYFEKNFQE